jgi:hypothetical protein
LAPFVEGLGAFCPRWSFAGAFVVCGAGFGLGFGAVTFRASLPPLTTGALFDASGFLLAGPAGPWCGWAVVAGCCPRRGAFLAGAFVSTGFFSVTVGAILAWGFGTLGVRVAGFVSAVTGCDGLRPRLWDGAAMGVVVAEEDVGFSDGRSLVVATGGCWGIVSVEPTRPAAAIAARTSARKSTTGLVEPTGLATGVETGGTTGVILASTTGR